MSKRNRAAKPTDPMAGSAFKRRQRNRKIRAARQSRMRAHAQYRVLVQRYGPGRYRDLSGDRKIRFVSSGPMAVIRLTVPSRGGAVAANAVYRRTHRVLSLLVQQNTLALLYRAVAGRQCIVCGGGHSTFRCATLLRRDMEFLRSGAASGLTDPELFEMEVERDLIARAFLPLMLARKVLGTGIKAPLAIAAGAVKVSDSVVYIATGSSPSSSLPSLSAIVTRTLPKLPEFKRCVDCPARRQYGYRWLMYLATGQYNYYKCPNCNSAVRYVNGVFEYE